MAHSSLTFSVHSAGRPAVQLQLNKPAIKIGRETTADFCIDDPAVASMHAMIEVRGADVALIDLGNEHPTRVNGHPIAHCALREGDQILLGSTVLVLDQISAPQHVPAVAPTVAAGEEHPWEAELAPNLFTQASMHDAFAVTEAIPATESADEGFCTYEMLRSGPDVASSEVELPHTQAVEVTVLWGRNVLLTKHLSDTESFTVGEETAGAGAVDYFLPSEKVGGTRVPVVVRRGQSASVVIPGNARGSLTRGDETVDVEQARDELAHSSELHGAVEWPLAVGCEARLQFGDVALLVRTVNAAKPVPHGIGSSMDWNTAAYFGASFFSVGALLSTMAFLVPPMGITDGEMSVDEQAMLIMQFLDTNAEKETEPEETDADSNDSDEGGTGERAQDDEGAMGKQEAAPTNRRYAVKGNPDTPDPHLAREQAVRDASEFGMIGLLNSGPGGDPNAPTAPWGRETSLGLDDMSAMGNMWGDEIGESGGSGGFGLTGQGQGGGGLGFGVGLGKIGTFGHGDGLGPGDGFGNGHGRPQGSHKTTVPRMQMGQTTVSGRLPAQVIQRIVRQNFGRFRLCYERALSANPNLEGRVAVRFVIDRNGAVSNAANGGSSLPSSEVTSCVVQAFYGLSFPKPEGGIVTVSYPIAFSPG